MLGAELTVKDTRPTAEEPPQADMTPEAIIIPHETYTLSNGLTVILHEDHTLPQVVVNIWFRVGSKDEQQGRSGFAHLFEHLMFMGTERVPEARFDELIEAHGGWNNAWTAEDATNYYDVGPRQLLETFLWLEADRMGSLDSAMTQDKLDKQREVVRNELRQTTEDTPYGRAWNQLPALCFPSGHPYAHPVIGCHEDIVAATTEDVIRFFQTWYVPNNASLVIAGDFCSDEIKPVVEACFGGLAPRPLPERFIPEPPHQPVVPLYETTDAVKVPLSLMVWHTPAAYQQGDAAMSVLAAVLSDGRSSRLYTALVHNDSIAIESSAYQYSQMLSSQFILELKPADGVTLEAIEARAFAELQRVAAEGLQPGELLRVLNQLELSVLQGLESLQERASKLNRYQAMVGDSGFLQADLTRYRTITNADVQAAAAALCDAQPAILRVRPEAGEE